MGIAVFHARRLSEDEGAAKQRGARCVSLGLIVSCPPDPSGQLKVLLPHLPMLSQLAIEVAHGAEPPSVKLYLAKYMPSKVPTPPTLEQLSYDPATYMLSMHRFVGPLLAPLLKLLLLPRRLLLYAPAPVERSAIVAFNLAELVHAAFAYAVDVPGHVRIYGMLSLHDVEEWKRITPTDTAWIAWTSDRILLDKTDMFDVCLDISALAFSGTSTVPVPSKPLARFIKTAALKPANLTWSTRDLCLFLELAEQERRYENVLKDEGRPTFDAWREAESLSLASCSLHVSMLVPWRYKQQDARMLLAGYVVVWIASIRFWLTEWWLIRSQLQVAVPLSLVMPLGVRDDGGMSTGIVDLHDASSDMADVSGDSLSKPCGTSTALEGTFDSRVESTAAVDPLVAAYGLSLRAKSPRPLSSSSRPSSGFSQLAPVAERTIIPAHPRYDPDDAPHLPLESMIGMYVFTLWSSYVRARHIQVSAFLDERVASLPHVPTESSSLLSPRTICMTSNMFHKLGLDSSCAIDCAWLQSLLTPHHCQLKVCQWWWPWC